MKRKHEERKEDEGKEEKIKREEEKNNKRDLKLRELESSYLDTKALLEKKTLDFISLIKVEKEQESKRLNQIWEKKKKEIESFVESTQNVEKFSLKEKMFHDGIFPWRLVQYEETDPIVITWEPTGFEIELAPHFSHKLKQKNLKEPLGLQLRYFWLKEKEFPEGSSLKIWIGLEIPKVHLRVPPGVISTRLYLDSETRKTFQQISMFPLFIIELPEPELYCFFFSPTKCILISERQLKIGTLKPIPLKLKYKSPIRVEPLHIEKFGKRIQPKNFQEHKFIYIFCNTTKNSLFVAIKWTNKEKNSTLFSLEWIPVAKLGAYDIHDFLIPLPEDTTLSGREPKNFCFAYLIENRIRCRIIQNGKEAFFVFLMRNNFPHPPNFVPRLLQVEHNGLGIFFLFNSHLQFHKIVNGKPNEESSWMVFSRFPDSFDSSLTFECYKEGDKNLLLLPVGRSLCVLNIEDGKLLQTIDFPFQIWTVQVILNLVYLTFIQKTGKKKILIYQLR